MNQFRKLFLPILLLSLSFYAHAQNEKTIDFHKSIKEYDLSSLWCADSVLFFDFDDNNPLGIGKAYKTSFPEPLGFIGDNYQRFYIHFLSVKKNLENPYQYIVSGKTKVKNNICKFTGTITITQAKAYKGNYDKKFKQGIVYSVCKFHEDSSTNSSGMITGKLETNFYLNKQQHIFYDNLEFVADGYCNNQFIGTWMSYKTKSIKKCHWGDYRIPDSGNLDEGAGEFSPYDTYLQYGWQSYRDANLSDDSVASKKAMTVENKHWWK